MAITDLLGHQEVTCLADRLEGEAPPADRRIHRRITARDLRWLRGARIKYGNEVHVLDISAGGMLLESDRELDASASVVIELTGTGAPILIPAKMLRCRVSLGEILRYQGACAFKRPLTIPELAVCPPPAPAVAGAPTSAPQLSTTWQKVIARYTDGRILGGYTNDFHPSKPQLHISSNPRQGDSSVVPLSQLKALFFVREFLGDPTLVERREFTDPPQGRKVEITFHDGEVIVGSTLGYRRDGHGFFVQPADGRSNNLRIFVTSRGLQHMRFL